MHKYSARIVQNRLNKAGRFVQSAENKENSKKVLHIYSKSGTILRDSHVIFDDDIVPLFE